jgi:hypothetical protein
MAISFFMGIRLLMGMRLPHAGMPKSTAGGCDSVLGSAVRRRMTARADGVLHLA